MFKKIYQELVAIRTELQLIRNEMESVKKIWVGIDMRGEGESDFSLIIGEDKLENCLVTSEKPSNSNKLLFNEPLSVEDYQNVVKKYGIPHTASLT